VAASTRCGCYSSINSSLHTHPLIGSRVCCFCCGCSCPSQVVYQRLSEQGSSSQQQQQEEDDHQQPLTLGMDNTAQSVGFSYLLSVRHGCKKQCAIGGLLGSTRCRVSPSDCLAFTQEEWVGLQATILMSIHKNSAAPVPPSCVVQERDMCDDPAASNTFLWHLHRATLSDLVGRVVVVEAVGCGAGERGCKGSGTGRCESWGRGRGMGTQRRLVCMAASAAPLVLSCTGWWH
jgi:hypothetical protein